MDLSSNTIYSLQNPVGPKAFPRIDFGKEGIRSTDTPFPEPSSIQNAPDWRTFDQSTPKRDINGLTNLATSDDSHTSKSSDSVRGPSRSKLSMLATVRPDADMSLIRDYPSVPAWFRPREDVSSTRKSEMQTSVASHIKPRRKLPDQFHMETPKTLSSPSPMETLRKLSTPSLALTTKRALPVPVDDDRVRKKAKTMLGLPLTLDADGGPATVLACADSGSEANIIALELARALGYKITDGPSRRREFMLANGSTVEAVGEIVAKCSFEVDASPATPPISCVFHVFRKLASPLIMGDPFLKRTETLSKHRQRLIRVPRPARQSLQVYSVGRPRDQLYCYLDGVYIPALPDSGSEINLMTWSFAMRKGFHIQPGKEVIEFADGSIAMTSGVVTAELKTRDNNSINYRRVLKAKFHLLHTLRHEVIMGEDHLEELEIFTKGQHLFFPVLGHAGPAGVNRLRHLGTIDQVLEWVKERILRRKRRQASSATDMLSSTWSIDDQQENDRREREELRIAGLPRDQQDDAIKAEALIQAQYDNNRGRSN